VATTAVPTDPDALLARIYADTAKNGKGTSPDQKAFQGIGEIIAESVLPPGLAGALYVVAARIPGVELVEESTDAAGRGGIALARTGEDFGARDEWIFDRNTYEYLGQRSVQTRPLAGVPAGTVTSLSAVVKRAVVDTAPPLETPQTGGARTT
jgi:hypothetical protein